MGEFRKVGMAGRGGEAGPSTPLEDQFEEASKARRSAENEAWNRAMRAQLRRLRENIQRGSSGFEKVAGGATFARPEDAGVFLEKLLEEIGLESTAQWSEIDDNARDAGYVYLLEAIIEEMNRDWEFKKMDRITMAADATLLADLAAVAVEFSERRLRSAGTNEVVPVGQLLRGIAFKFRVAGEKSDPRGGQTAVRWSDLGAKMVERGFGLRIPLAHPVLGFAIAGTFSEEVRYRSRHMTVRQGRHRANGPVERPDLVGEEDIRVETEVIWGAKRLLDDIKSLKRSGAGDSSLKELIVNGPRGRGEDVTFSRMVEDLFALTHLAKQGRVSMACKGHTNYQRADLIERTQVRIKKPPTSENYENPGADANESVIANKAKGTRRRVNVQEDSSASEGEDTRDEVRTVGVESSAFVLRLDMADWKHILASPWPLDEVTTDEGVISEDVEVNAAVRIDHTLGVRGGADESITKNMAGYGMLSDTMSLEHHGAESTPRDKLDALGIVVEDMSNDTVNPLEEDIEDTGAGIGSFYSRGEEGTDHLEIDAAHYPGEAFVETSAYSNEDHARVNNVEDGFLHDNGTSNSTGDNPVSDANVLIMQRQREADESHAQMAAAEVSAAEATQAEAAQMETAAADAAAVGTAAEAAAAGAAAAEATSAKEAEAQAAKAAETAAEVAKAAATAALESRRRAIREQKAEAKRAAMGTAQKKAEESRALRRSAREAIQKEAERIRAESSCHLKIAEAAQRADEARDAVALEEETLSAEKRMKQVRKVASAVESARLHTTQGMPGGPPNEPGVEPRRGKRWRTRPLNYWENERVFYTRAHDELPTVAEVQMHAPSEDDDDDDDGDDDDGLIPLDAHHRNKFLTKSAEGREQKRVVQLGERRKGDEEIRKISAAKATARIGKKQRTSRIDVRDSEEEPHPSTNRRCKLDGQTVPSHESLLATSKDLLGEEDVSISGATPTHTWTGEGIPLPSGGASNARRGLIESFYAVDSRSPSVGQSGYAVSVSASPEPASSALASSPSIWSRIFSSFTPRLSIFGLQSAGSPNVHSEGTTPVMANAVSSPESPIGLVSNPKDWSAPSSSAAVQESPTVMAGDSPHRHRKHSRRGTQRNLFPQASSPQALSTLRKRKWMNGPGKEDAAVDFSDRSKSMRATKIEKTGSPSLGIAGMTRVFTSLWRNLSGRILGGVSMGSP